MSSEDAIEFCYSSKLVNSILDQVCAEQAVCTLDDHLYLRKYGSKNCPTLEISISLVV